MTSVTLRPSCLTLALLLLLIVGTHPSPAAELPAAATPQLPEQAATSTLSGILIDRDGDSIPSARVTLTVDANPARTAVTAPDGRFTFANLSAGPYSLSIAASGFAPHQATGVLRPGEDRTLPEISLTSATTTNIEVTATQTEIAQAQVNQEEKQRVLAVIPNFYVVYDSNPAPLAPRQKYSLAFRTLVDPMTFVLNGITAGAEQATGTFAWEQGASGYAKRFAAGYGNILTDTIITNAVFPVLFKQDPRYFYKGTGSIASRAGNAIAQSVLCKGDNMRWQVNYSGILGSLASNGISNAYYPAANRAGATLTFEGLGIGTAETAVQNLIQEFLIPKLTPHLPHRTP